MPDIDFTHSALFANWGTLHEVSKYLMGDVSSTRTFWFGVIVAIVVSLWILLAATQFWNRRVLGLGQTHGELLRDLCRLHRLSNYQTRLVYHAAGELPPAEQTRVFTDPRVLRAKVSPHSEAGVEYGRLVQLLFGSAPSRVSAG